MSHKSRDQKNRWRNKTVGFRVSPEEWNEIERLVLLSGMSKQDYIMHRLQNMEMTIQANPRVVKALKNEIIELCNLRGEIESFKEDDEILKRMEYILKIIEPVSKTELAVSK